MQNGTRCVALTLQLVMKLHPILNFRGVFGVQSKKKCKVGGSFVTSCKVQTTKTPLLKEGCGFRLYHYMVGEKLSCDCSFKFLAEFQFQLQKFASNQDFYFSESQVYLCSKGSEYAQRKTSTGKFECTICRLKVMEFEKRNLGKKNGRNKTI